MKYENLQQVILSLRNLIEATTSVVRNKGAAGVDGMKVGELEAYLQLNWKSIHTQILKGSYIPQAVRGVGDTQTQCWSAYAWHTYGGRSYDSTSYPAGVKPHL